MQIRFSVLTLLMVSLTASMAVSAQQTDTTKPTSIDPALMELANANPKSPKDYYIAGIAISGTKYLDESLLLSISSLSKGDKIVIPGGDNFSKAIQNLWKQNLFSNIQIFYTKVVGDSIWIEINVTERPRLSNFVFKGVKKGDHDDLEKKSGLVKGRVVTENTKLTAVQNIQKYYAEKGFKSAAVEVQEKPDPSLVNSEILTFQINKGNKVRVNEINFYGNEDVSGLKLKKQLKGTKEMTKFTIFPVQKESAYGVNKKITFGAYVKDWGFLSFSKTREFLDPYFRFKFFSNAKFDQKKYEDDKAKVIEFYNSLGYRDAAIVADTQYYAKDGNLDVDIKVSEGHKYYFGNITWKGNTKYSDSVLSAGLGIHKGDLYDLKTLNKRLGKEQQGEGGDISSVYQDDGYLFFQITPVETAVYNDTIDHEIQIREGPQATIKNVTIAGNEKTKEYVIRRELRTVPGDKFSRSDVIRSTREISQLGFINPEKTIPNIQPNQEDGTVDIAWTVEEKSADQLELSAGWGGGIGLTGTVGVTFNNFSIDNILHKKAWQPLPQGDGQKLSLRIQSNGKAYQTYNVSFTEPWFGGKKRNSLTVSLYKSTFHTSGFNYSTSKYAFSDTNSLNNLGASIGLTKQLKWPDDFFTLGYSLNYTRYQLHNYPLFSAAFTNGVSNNINIKLVLQRNSAGPNPIYPTSGSNLMLSGQFTPPYSLFDPSIVTSADPYRLIEYHKWRFTSSFFLPIGQPLGADKSKQLVLMASVKYGFIGRYNNKMAYSPFERFQVGDAGLTNYNGVLGYDIISQRGYPVYQSSDPSVNPTTSVQQAQQFFIMFNKYTVELRFPFTTNPSSTIYGLTFFEAANGWYDYQDYNPFRLRRSAGVGMRFFLPMFGLLGFDYGVGFDRIQPGGSLGSGAKFTFMLGYEPD